MKAKISNRIMRHSQSLCRNIQADCNFSPKLASYRFFGDVAALVHSRKIAGFFYRKKHQYILNYLQNELSAVIEKYSDATDVGEFSQNAPIWVCWWQGMSDAPALVKRCVYSICEHSNGHPVHLITKDTIEKYISIPSYIYKKAMAGEMNLANYADYLRMSLLAQYGGIWLDATILMSQDIPSEYFEWQFFSCKSKNIVKNQMLAVSGLWTTYAIGGWKESSPLRFIREAFEHYWSHHNITIDYLMFDYIIDIARRNLPIFQGMIDSLPENNEKRNALRDAMLRDEPLENFEKYKGADFVINKLSYKSLYGQRSKDGRETIYSYLMNNPAPDVIDAFFKIFD